jgi:hypothetical protein
MTTALVRYSNGVIVKSCFYKLYTDFRTKYKDMFHVPVKQLYDILKASNLQRLYEVHTFGHSDVPEILYYTELAGDSPAQNLEGYHLPGLFCT